MLFLEVSFFHFIHLKPKPSILNAPQTSYLFFIISNMIIVVLQGSWNSKFLTKSLSKTWTLLDYRWSLKTKITKVLIVQLKCLPVLEHAIILNFGKPVHNTSKIPFSFTIMSNLCATFLKNYELLTTTLHMV